MSIEEMWDALKDDYGVSEQTLQVITPEILRKLVEGLR